MMDWNVAKEMFWNKSSHQKHRSSVEYTEYEKQIKQISDAENMRNLLDIDNLYKSNDYALMSNTLYSNKSNIPMMHNWVIKFDEKSLIKRNQLK